MNIHLHLVPKSSCLIGKLEYFLKDDSLITFESFDSLDDMTPDKVNQKPDFIINFSNSKEVSYDNLIKDTIKLIQSYEHNGPGPHLVLASSVGTQPKYMNLGDKAQLEYNIDRANAERTMHKMDQSGLILKIPLVSCKDDSLLKRFKRKEISSDELTNRTKEIPVLSPRAFCISTIGYIKTFYIYKEIHYSSLVVEYKAEHKSIENLQNSLASSTDLDYLLQ